MTCHLCQQLVHLLHAASHAVHNQLQDQARPRQHAQKQRLGELETRKPTLGNQQADAAWSWNYDIIMDNMNEIMYFHESLQFTPQVMSQSVQDDGQVARTAHNTWNNFWVTAGTWRIAQSRRPMLRPWPLERTICFEIGIVPELWTKLLATPEWTLSYMNLTQPKGARATITRNGTSNKSYCTTSEYV